MSRLGLSHPPAETEIRLQVPEFVARTDFELDAARAVAVDEQLAVAENPDDEIDRRVVQRHHLPYGEGRFRRAMIFASTVPLFLWRAL